MASAEEELEKRSKFLSSLIQNKKSVEEQQQQQQQQQQHNHHHHHHHHQGLFNVRIRASDMPIALQNKALEFATHHLHSMPSKTLDSKRLALALKKDFDAAYGTAWHCIVGTSFGSYVTHSLGGFLYFSIDKVYVLLFRTAVEPLQH